MGMIREMVTGGVTAPQGFLASGVAAGIRKKEREDVAVVYSLCPANGAAVYTQNKFKAAPLQITAENLANGQIQAMVINSGIANAGMGEVGLAQARQMADWTAEALQMASGDVVVASTGVIGMPLPMDKIHEGIIKGAASLTADGGALAARAIMTTDLVKKEIALQFALGGKLVTMGAMAKGSGMINPNMCTMLGFVTTDVAIDQGTLQKVLSAVVDETFNMISVDGDTSTNDMVVIMANGLAGNVPLTEENAELAVFTEALCLVCTFLAKAIAADGEGATKLIETTVRGAATLADARRAAKAVIQSSLVKTAIFGEDANWGRIACALGYSGAAFDPGRVSIALGEVMVAENGMGLTFDEAKAATVLREKTVTITVDLGAGEATATAWGCDLTYDYVKINADYRS